MSAPAPNSEWVEWPAGEYRPKGIRFRKEWTVGQISEGRYYAHRDDLAADATHARRGNPLPTREG